MEQLDEITGIGRTAAQVAIAEIGVDMGRFPTPGHLCSWAKYAPGISESAGKKKGAGATGHGNPYLARILGEAAIAVSRTDTFLGERYRRIARRCGAKKAIVALGRSILVIIWHTCCPTPTPDSTTWARTSTPTTPTGNARSATTSANSTPWATESTSTQPPNGLTGQPCHNEPGSAALRRVLRLPTPVRFSDQ